MTVVHPYRTTEARWFRRGTTPDAVRAWFDGLGPLPEPESRADRYLAPVSDALSVKLREGRVEAKRLDGAAGRLRVGRAVAGLSAWSKWSLGLAGAVEVAGPWITVEKTRRQHERSADGATCSLELAEVRVEGEAWWSVCLEAAGPNRDARRTALIEAAGTWLGRDDAPALPSETAVGYPAWLRMLTSTDSTDSP